ncbi:acetamidase/formamidase family protein [Allonocardiopsis opalescens]|uniref:Acetamidase/formamidase n=1 Tax=Allonocardiopsis opalescens TaxID=1144618 RepID=A0A2T0Q2J0_9ACTN|nr:acetamidase/formamidase family protein [Allonocardiopsis opalescens]PRX98005.1 acetamidase/formamidase [Allonocardiopsis opalescens]
MGTSYALEPDDRTLRGHFSPDFPPVLSVDPGDSVRVRTLDAWWSTGPYLGDDVAERPRVPQYREGYGHALTGPIEVRGAQPGMVLEVRVDAVVPDVWGTCALAQPELNARYGLPPAGTVHDWTLDPVAMTGRNQHGHTVGLRPFLGIMGMPPPEPGLHPTFPPRRHGGNLDCKDLVAGSTLYLPVPVEGALFSVGDGHAAQGDGEIGGTAIECPMRRVDLRLDLRDDWALDTPVAHTPSGWLAFGLAEDLDTATARALDAMFALIGRLHEVSRADAVMLASVAVDLRITQIVNGVVGVHAVLPPGAIR